MVGPDDARDPALIRMVYRRREPQDADYLRATVAQEAANRGKSSPLVVNAWEPRGELALAQISGHPPERRPGRVSLAINSDACQAAPVPGRQRYYIGHVQMRPQDVEKLATKHNLTMDDVRDAVQHPAVPLRSGWDDHPRYGGRLVLVGSTRDGRPVIVYLRPIDIADGTWELATAWPL